MIRFFSIIFLLITLGCKNLAKTATTSSGRIFVPIQFDNMTIYVAPDYYKVNGIRTPVDLDQAIHLVGQYNSILPTVSIVDAIWNSADIHLQPLPMSPGPNMASIPYISKHNSMIENQLGEYDNVSDKALIAGHKKDIVENTRKNGRVAIYGWHRENGKPIQPFSTVHGKYYYDYSHGLRFISKIAYDKDGTKIDLSEYLNSS